MKRIPIDARILPDYTHGEELMNMVTHIVGGGLGVIVTALCALITIRSGNVWGLVGSMIYCLSMLALYSVSSVYHGLRAGRAKKVMQVIDHCTIYLLIAGTYTPILLAGIRPLHPGLAWAVFGCEWGVALAAAALTAIDLKKYSKLSMACYIVMGWLIVIALKPTVEALTLRGFLWLLAGGVAYTIGAVLYVIGKKKRYMHSVFHIFVDLGSVLQAVCIIVYVLLPA